MTGAEAAVVQATGADASAVGDLLPYMDSIQTSIDAIQVSLLPYMDSVQARLQAIEQGVWVCVAVLIAAAFAYFAVRWFM